MSRWTSLLPHRVGVKLLAIDCSLSLLLCWSGHLVATLQCRPAGVLRSSAVLLQGAELFPATADCCQGQRCSQQPDP